MSEVLQKILEEVKTLSGDERRQLASLLHALNGADPAVPAEREFERRLAAEGWLSLPTRLSGGQACEQLTPPIDVGARRLSEILIEERR